MLSNHSMSLDIQMARLLRTLDSYPIYPVYRTRCLPHHPHTSLHGAHRGCHHPQKLDLSWIRLLLDPKPPSSQHIQTWRMASPTMATIVMTRTSSLLHADTIHALQDLPLRLPNSVLVRGAQLIHPSLNLQHTRSFTRTTRW